MILFVRNKTSSSFAPQKSVNEAYFRGAKGDNKKITALECDGCYEITPRSVVQLSVVQLKSGIFLFVQG